MERELVSVDKNSTRVLLKPNNAPTILEFCLTHLPRNRYHRDESTFFVFFHFFFLSCLRR